MSQDLLFPHWRSAPSSIEPSTSISLSGLHLVQIPVPLPRILTQHIHPRCPLDPLRRHRQGLPMRTDKITRFSICNQRVLHVPARVRLLVEKKRRGGWAAKMGKRCPWQVWVLEGDVGAVGLTICQRSRGS